MKKYMILLVVMLSVVCVKAQVSVTGDVGFYTKNISTFTGLMFGEEPAVVSHFNTNVQLKDFNFSASYTGQHAIHHVTEGDRFNMLDLYCSYSVNKELNLSVGYELTYSDNKDNDEFGQGVFAMATWTRNKVSSNLIFFADPKMENRYYIGSLNLQVGKSVSIYALAGYTNTKTSPYGLIGVNYSTGMVTIGAYCAVDRDNPGPLVRVVFPF